MDYRPLKSQFLTGRLSTILITAFISISATLIFLRLSPPGGRLSSFVPVAVGPPSQQEGSSRIGGGVVVVPGGLGNGLDGEEGKKDWSGGMNVHVEVVTSTSVVLETVTATSTMLKSENTAAAIMVNLNCHQMEDSLEVLREMEQKYSGLMEDKFT